MKRHHRLDAGAARQRSGLPGGEVVLRGGTRAVPVQERSFDEQHIGATRELHDPRGVVRGVHRVGDVGDLLPRHNPQHRARQLPERKEALAHSPVLAPPHPKRRIVRRPGAHRALELLEPRARRKPERIELVLPDVQVPVLFECERQTRRHVVEESAAHAERLRLEQQTVRKCDGFLVLPAESVLAVKRRTPAAPLRRGLRHLEREIGFVTADEIPGIGGEAVLDLRQKPGRAEEPHLEAASEAETQQPVEAHEMIHVGVRHEHVAQAQDLARGQQPDVAQIEKHGAPLEQTVDIDAGVAEGVVDEHGVEKRSHGRSPRRRGPGAADRLRQTAARHAGGKTR